MFDLGGLRIYHCSYTKQCNFRTPDILKSFFNPSFYPGQPFSFILASPLVQLSSLAKARMADINAAEKQQQHHFVHSAHSDDSTHAKETGIIHEETAHEAAARGHLATDK